MLTEAPVHVPDRFETEDWGEEAFINAPVVIIDTLSMKMNCNSIEIRRI